MPQTVIHLFRQSVGEVAPLQKWLEGLEKREPRAYGKCLERILRLSELGNELRRPLADLLRDGIYELRVRIGTVNYRMLYFFSGKCEAVLSHGLTKEEDVPDIEINRAIARRSLVTKDRNKHLADWELSE